MLFCPRDASALRSADAAGDRIGQIIGGRYQLKSKIGEGGMGEVYLAEHVRMGRRCAIKLIKSTFAGDADAVGRFAREASNASRMNHANVATIYDFGEAEGQLLYLAMEYVDGAPLSRLLDGVTPVPLGGPSGSRFRLPMPCHRRTRWVSCTATSSRTT